MGARNAQIGLVGYAATLVVLVGVGFWSSFLMGRLGHEHGLGLDLQFKILNALYLSLEVLAIVALAFVSRVPAVTRARRLLVASAIVAGVALVVGQGQRLIIDGHLVSYERIETMMRIIGVVTAALYAASEILLAVAGVRIAAAAGSEPVRRLAFAALAVRALLFVLQLLPIGFAGLGWLHRANNLLFAGMCVALSAVVTRIAEPRAVTVAADAGDGRLSNEWRAPADGISLYLGAGAGRVACALAGWLVMLGARSAHDLSALRDVRDQLIIVAVLTSVATITMLAALWRISSSPLESRASGPALVALTLALIGFGLDLWSTYITADALDGNVSAAFFAMDALPIIAGIAGLIGIGAAVALLVALRNLATSLVLPDVADRARGAIGFVLGTGALFGVALALTRAPELMLAVAVLALPLAVATLVQFLRVALAVGREIRARL